MMPSLFTLDRQEITSLYEQGGEVQRMASYCGCDCCVNQPHKLIKSINHLKFCFIFMQPSVQFRLMSLRPTQTVSVQIYILQNRKTKNATVKTINYKVT